MQDELNILKNDVLRTFLEAIKNGLLNEPDSFYDLYLKNCLQKCLHLAVKAVRIEK
jgi:hypothetical protein